MPIYTYMCPDSHTCQFLLSFKQKEDPGSAGCTCPTCGSKDLTPVFDPGDFGAILRDGESGSWASKALKEKAVRARRWAALGQKTKDHVRPNNLVPNYNGQIHDRWSDIQDHVRSKEGAEAASSYAPFVEKEKGGLRCGNSTRS